LVKKNGRVNIISLGVISSLKDQIIEMSRRDNSLHPSEILSVLMYRTAE
jgi:hypothetical protein